MTLTTAAAARSNQTRHRTAGASTMVKVVCLDVDETLVDYDVSLRAGLRAMIGTDTAWAEWYQLTERHFPRYVAGEVDFDTMRRERTRDFFVSRGVELSDHEVADRENRRMAAMRQAWSLFDDALPCLRELRSAGLLLAAITNAASGHQRAKLDAVGLDSVFDAVLISGEVGMAKPDPEIFHTACARLGVAAHEAAHVGDRLDLDAEAARDAGLHGVWLNRAGIGVQRGRDRGEQGISVISGLVELPGLITRLGVG